jgi:curved DNA-binding protein
MKKDYYEILGVSKNADEKTLKAAYRKLALEWHPYRNKSAEADKKFKEISEAYEVLSNPQKKQAYDQYGHAGVNNGAPGGNPFSGGFPGGFSYTYRSGGGQDPFGNIDPFEIFEQFFGGGNPFAQQRLPRYELTIDFIDAYKGTTKEVSVESKKRSVKIPAGVETGSQIRFNDFIAVVRVKPHKVFEREGADVIAEVKVPLYLAITGGELDVPTLDGETKIRIRPGTQAGAILRITGKGMPYLNRHGHGDLYFKLLIDIPAYKDLTNDQKKAIDILK